MGKSLHALLADDDVTHSGSVAHENTVLLFDEIVVIEENDRDRFHA